MLILSVASLSLHRPVMPHERIVARPILRGVGYTLLIIITLPTLYVAQAKQAVQNRALVFINITVIDCTGASAKKDMTVVVIGDRITAIGKTGKVKIPTSATTVNARGKYLIPGLIDTHVHLAWDLDQHFSLTTAEQLRLLYLPNGITSIREASTRGLEQRTIEAREEAKRPEVFMPQIYVSGRVDAQRIKQSGLTAGELTRRLITQNVDAIKIRYGLSLDDIRDVVREARKAGKPVWGHTYSIGKDYTREAVLMGVQGVTHVVGIPQLGTRSRPERQPDDSSDWQVWIYGATNWLYTDEKATDSLIRLMVKHKAWLEPTLITEKYVIGDEYFRNQPTVKYSVMPYEKRREGFPKPTGEDLRRYTAAFERMKDFVRRFHKVGGLVIAGTDGIPYPGFGIHDELHLLVEAGLSPMEALQAATRNAARALNWEATLGTVQTGKQADLVLLDANPLEDINNTKSIYAVVTKGRYLSKEALDKMLADVEEAAKKNDSSLKL